MCCGLLHILFVKLYVSLSFFFCLMHFSFVFFFSALVFLPSLCIVNKVGLSKSKKKVKIDQPGRETVRNTV